MALKDKWVDKRNNVDDVNAEDINDIANAVIYIEENGAANNFNYDDYDIPVLYFDGDITQMSKDNKVTLAYQYGDKSGTCTLKWQGSSSLAYPKKNYTVVFDNAFEAAEGWGEQTKYCLKADWIDFSHCRNVGTAKLWGQIVKSRATSDLTTRLSALVNGGAIDGFPCFVVINDEWKGIYNFNIPKEGYMLGMGSGTKEAILCGNNQSKGNLFKAETIIGEDYDLEYNSDTFTEDEIQGSFNTLVRAVLNSDGSDIDTTIAQYLDIDSAIDYYILTVILKGADIISKNAIFATYDGVKWFMSAYDLDSTWGLKPNGNLFLNADYNWADDDTILCTFYSLSTGHGLFNLLYAYKKAEIIARYKELRGLILSPSYVTKLFYNYAKNIPHAVYEAENELWTGRPSTSASNIEQITQWYTERIKWVDAEIMQMEEIVNQVATEGLAYTIDWQNINYKNSRFAATITGIGTATDTDIVIPKWIEDNPVIKIKADAFRGNTNITSVVLPEGIKSIGDRAFYQATNLASVSLPESVTELKLSAFSTTALSEITLPNNVTVIPDYFVYDCSNLTSIKMGNRVTEIKNSAFSECTSLPEIRLSKALKTIGESGFANCVAMTKINLPDSLETIGENAFTRSVILPFIIIPARVKTVGVKAFASTWNLKEVIFKGTPESIGENAFFECGSNNTDGVHIYVPWAEGEVAGAPWGATKATMHYNSIV